LIQELEKQISFDIVEEFKLKSNGAISSKDEIRGV
jgi:hypothetical protein